MRNSFQRMWNQWETSNLVEGKPIATIHEGTSLYYKKFTRTRTQVSESMSICTIGNHIFTLLPEWHLSTNNVEFYWNLERLYSATIWQNTVWKTVLEQFAEILSEIIWDIVAVWENAQGHRTRLLEPCAERGTPVVSHHPPSEVIGSDDGGGFEMKRMNKKLI